MAARSQTDSARLDGLETEAGSQPLTDYDLQSTLGLVELMVFIAIASAVYVGIYNFFAARFTPGRM